MTSIYLTRKIRHLIISANPVKNNASRDCIEMPISANYNVKDFDNHNVETQEQSSALAYKTPRESKGTGFQLSN